MAITIIDHVTVRSMHLLLITLDHHVSKGNQVCLFINRQATKILVTLGASPNVRGRDRWIHVLSALNSILRKSVDPIQLSQHDLWFITSSSSSNRLNLTVNGCNYQQNDMSKMHSFNTLYITDLPRYDQNNVSHRQCMFSDTWPCCQHAQPTSLQLYPDPKSCGIEPHAPGPIKQGYIKMIT